MLTMLDLFCKVTAAVAYRLVQEYKALEELELAQLGLANGDEITDQNYHDVYVTTSKVGFSNEPGRLTKED